ncbi:MAG: virulence factor TspB C-terminal domain-related protein [Candidatus Methanomethylicaceae archaeon]
MCTLRRCVYFISLMLFAGLASAQTYVYETVRVGPGQYATTGIRAPVTVRVNNTFHQIVPVANKSVVGALARKAIRGGGVGLAVAGAIEGLGYLVDRATGDIKKREYETVPGAGASVSGVTTVSCQNTMPHIPGYNQCVSTCRASEFCYIGPSVFGDEAEDIYGWSCPASHPYSIETLEHNRRCFSQPFETIERIIDLDPADFERIDDHLEDRLSLSDKSSIVRGAIIDVSPSGSVSSADYPITDLRSRPAVDDLYDTWPELRRLIVRLLNAEIAKDLAAADPEFEISPEDKIILDGGSTTPPMTEWPSFCEWASWICEPFIADEHPDVPELDLQIPDYDSDLPNSATCPAPIVFETVFFGQYEISLQPACDMAAAIRLPLLAISYLVAGFIVVGVRR